MANSLLFKKYKRRYGDRTFRNYELNIVFSHNNRQHVARYNSQTNSINDANALAALLGVPLVQGQYPVGR